MPLALYADDSSDEKQQIMLTAGGFIGWPERFVEAERHWERRLNKDHIAYFRASDCEALEGEFSPAKRGMGLSEARASAESIRYDLIQIIEAEMGMAGIAFSLDLGDFQRVVSTNPKAKKHYGTDPQILVYRKLIKGTIEFLNKDWPEDRKTPIAFEFDDHAHWREAEEAYAVLRHDPECADRIGRIGHADDRLFIPLQMADLMAYEARHYSTAIARGSAFVRPTFKALTQRSSTVYVIALMREKELLYDLDKAPD